MDCVYCLLLYYFFLLFIFMYITPPAMKSSMNIVRIDLVLISYPSFFILKNSPTHAENNNPAISGYNHRSLSSPSFTYSLFGIVDTYGVSSVANSSICYFYRCSRIVAIRCNGFFKPVVAVR